MGISKFIGTFPSVIYIQEISLHNISYPLKCKTFIHLTDTKPRERILLSEQNIFMEHW